MPPAAVPDHAVDRPAAAPPEPPADETAQKGSQAATEGREPDQSSEHAVAKLIQQWNVGNAPVAFGPPAALRARLPGTGQSPTTITVAKICDPPHAGFVTKLHDLFIVLFLADERAANRSVPAGVESKGTVGVGLAAVGLV